MTGEKSRCLGSTNTQSASRRHTVALGGSAILCAAIGACHLIQPDILAPVILVPAWCWLLPGITLLAFGYRRTNSRQAVAVLVLWGLFTATLVEEAQSLLRFKSWPNAEWNQTCEHGRGVRVVSLNCGAGNANSVREIAAWNPDIVLLQESPSREQVDRLAGELFDAPGAFLYGRDTSILAVGQIQPKMPGRAAHFVHAEVQLPTGLKTDVISLRLAPPVFRLDFWAPGFWIDHRDKRGRHREQIAELVRHLQGIPESTNLIVGGDFNSPPSDAALAALRPRLVDAFRRAGRGWGGTGTSDYPLFRVDQIWISDGLRAGSVTAQRTIHSDHRMVVCDLLLDD